MVNVWKIKDDQWTQEKQKEQTKLAKSHDALLKKLTFGEEECNIVVRAKIQKEPLVSNCRPTLKIEIVPPLMDFQTSRLTTGKEESMSILHLNLF